MLCFSLPSLSRGALSALPAILWALIPMAAGAESPPADTAHPRVELEHTQLTHEDLGLSFTVDALDPGSRISREPWSAEVASELAAGDTPFPLEKTGLAFPDVLLVDEVIDEYSPDVAFNSNDNEYLVVYVRASGGASGNDIFCRRVGIDGQPIGPAWAVMALADDEWNPRVAYSPVLGDYLVAAEWDGPSGVDINFRYVGGDGIPFGGIFDAFPGTLDVRNPEVVYNSFSTDFLITADEDAIGHTDIFLRTVSASGLNDSVSSIAIDVSGVPISERNARATHIPSTGEYWLVYEADFANVDLGVDVFGFRTDFDFASATAFTIGALTANGMPRDDREPSISCREALGYCFVAWAFDLNGDGSNHDLFGRQMFLATSLGGGVVDIARSADDERRPEQIFLPFDTEHAMTWAVGGASPRGRSVVFDGAGVATLDPIFELSSDILPAGPAPLDGQGDAALTAWDPVGSLGADIRGRLLGPQTPFLSVDTVAIAFGTDIESSTFAISNLGEGELIWSASSNVSWLGLSLTSGSVFQDETVVTATVDRSVVLPGSYTGVVTVTSNAGSHTVDVSMTVVNRPPSPPSLPNPADGAVDQLAASGDPLAIPLIWLSSDPDGEFVVNDVYFSTDPGKVAALDPTVQVADNLFGSSVWVHLDYAQTYYWRVVSFDATGSTTGPLWSFTTGTRLAPILEPILSPTNNTQPTFRWSAVPGVALYRFAISRNANMNPSEVTSFVAGTSYTPTTPLANGQYYWRVTTFGTPSYFSEIKPFEIDASVFPPPTLTPISGPTNLSTVTFQWSPVAGASSYRLQGSTESDFSVLFLDQTPVGTSYVASAVPEGTIHWRVASRNAVGKEGYYAAGSFVSDYTAPAAPAPIVLGTVTSLRRRVRCTGVRRAVTG